MGLINFINDNIKIFHFVKEIPTEQSKKGVHFVKMDDGRKGLYIVSALSGVIKLYDTDDYYVKTEADKNLADKASELKAMIDALTAMGVMKTYTTYALMDADKTAPKTESGDDFVYGQLAAVTEDADVSKNGLYRWKNGVWEFLKGLGDLSGYTKAGGSTKTAKELDDQIVQLAGEIPEADLINIQDGVWKTGDILKNAGYINATTGNIVSSEDYFYSDVIKFLPNIEIELINFNGSSTLRKGDFLDENLQSISYVSTDNAEHRAVSPAGTRFARFCCKPDSLTSINLVNTDRTKIDNITSQKPLFLNTIVLATEQQKIGLNFLEQAVKSIYLNAPSGKYSIASAWNITSAVIRIFNESKVEIAGWVSSSNETGLKKISFTERNNSGISGKAIIDFDIIASSSNINNLFTDVAYLNKWVFDKWNYNIVLEEYVNKINQLNRKPVENIELNNSGYISGVNGAIIQNPSYAYSDYYDVNEGDEFYMIGFGGTSSVLKMAAYNDVKAILLDNSIKTDSSILRKIVIPFGVKYVRFCALLNAFPQPRVLVKDSGNKRKNKIIATLNDFRLTDATINGDIVEVIGDGTDKRQLMYDVLTQLERIEYSVAFTVSEFDTSENFKFKIGRFNSQHSTYSAFELDKTNMTLKYKAYGDNVEKTAFQTAHGITIIPDKHILIKTTKDSTGMNITISDGETIFTKRIEQLEQDVIGAWNITNGIGCPYISVTSGNININNAILSSSYDVNSHAFIKGDSVIEGYTVATVTGDMKDRWIAKTADDIGNDKLVISAVGGLALDVYSVNNFVLENEWYRSEYVILELGINNQRLSVNSYIEMLSTLISYCKFRGQKPILVTITPMPEQSETSTAYRDFRETANAWIRNSGELFIDSAAAVTTDGHTWKEGYCLADLTHPTKIGHSAIYNRAKIDVPELFSV